MGGVRCEWEGGLSLLTFQEGPLSAMFCYLSVQSSAAAEEPSSPSSPSSYHQFTLPEGGLPPGGHHRGDMLVHAPPRHTHFTWDWLYYYVPAKEIRGMRSAVMCALRWPVCTGRTNHQLKVTDTVQYG